MFSTLLRSRCIHPKRSWRCVREFSHTGDQAKVVRAVKDVRDFEATVASTAELPDVLPKIDLKGWVTSVRKHKTVSFLSVSDGSSALPLQVVVPRGEADEVMDSVSTGCSVRILGNLHNGRKPAQVEAKAQKLELIGECDSDYPIQKKYHTPEFLREVVHLRPRTTRIRSMLRVRSAASLAIHQHFNQEGFTLVNTPILTSLDCEGAGEQFDVSKETGGVKDDFFSDSKAMLTVSGQLHAEMFACALSNVYTFGPTFRAEDSNTSRHLAEFWMLEPEMAHTNLTSAVDSAESCIQGVLKSLMDTCADELDYFNSASQGEDVVDLFQRIELATSKPFMRISYSEALELLQSSQQDFGDFPLEWGCDLQSVHERFLANQVAGGAPIVVTDYPASLKPFYARKNEDGKTSAAFDVLVPQVGELVGGSVREERLEKLKANIDEKGMNAANLEWYLDLRRYGTVPHSGWGMGFERLIQFVTGIQNIRDAIPVPRYPGRMNL